MKISQLIEELEAIEEHCGDLPIVGGYLHDDTPPEQIVVLNKDGEDVRMEAGKAAGVFISA